MHQHLIWEGVAINHVSSCCTNHRLMPAWMNHLASPIQWMVRDFHINISYLRNRKHVPCFYQVIEARVKVWDNEKCSTAFWNSPKLSRVFP